MKKPRAFEWWMVSNVAAGAAALSFMTLLIPPFITQVTGSAARAGIVLAVIGLSALTGPYIGRLADRKKLHRQFYVLALLGLSMSFLLLALDASLVRYSPFIGILLGVCMAAQGTIGPAFIVGAGQKSETVAGQLTVFSLLLPTGQVIGAGVVVLGFAMGLSSTGQFFLASAVLAILAVWSWVTIGTPVKRMQEQAPAHKATYTKVSRKKVYFSVFGLFMLVATVGAIANNGMTSQIANILPTVYGFSHEATAALIGLAGLLSIGAIVLSGWWMKRRGPFPVYAGGSVIKWIGMLGMALVGILAGPHLLLAAFVVQVAYVAPLLTRTGAPNVSSILAPVSAAEANGYYFATSALGAFIGSLVAGYLADAVSFNAINWMAAILSGIALLILFVFLLPRAKAFSGLFTNAGPGGQKGSYSEKRI